MFDLKKCEVIMEIEKTRNITKAAQNLGYTQPGISNIVKAIEDEIGFPLFYRAHQGVSLTSEAEQLLPEIKTILAGVKSLEQTIDKINGYEIGNINIGSYSSTSIHFLSRWIEGFSKLYPKVTFSITEGGINDLEQALDSYKVELAIISRQSYHNYNWVPIISDPVCAVLPPDFYYTKEYFKAENYGQLPLIYHAKGTDADADNVISYFADHNIEPIYKYCISLDRTIMSMIEHHLGIGIIPELITKYYHGKLKVLPIEPQFQRELGIASLPDIPLSPVAKLFIRYCSEHIHK